MTSSAEKFGSYGEDLDGLASSCKSVLRYGRQLPHDATGGCAPYRAMRSHPCALLLDPHGAGPFAHDTQARQFQSCGSASTAAIQSGLRVRKNRERHRRSHVTKLAIVNGDPIGRLLSLDFAR